MAMIYKTKWMYEKLNALSQQPDEDDDAYRQRYRDTKTELWKAEIENAEAKAIMKAIENAKSLVIRQQIEDGNWEGLPDRLQELYAQIRNRNGNGGAIYSHYWVTLNVAPGVLLDDVKSKVRKFVNRKMCASTEWVYEQRGSTEDEMGKGLHVHMLVRPAKPIGLTQFRRNTVSTFKTLVGNEKAVDVRPCKAQSDVDKRRKYMSGEKDDPEKMKKCAVDKMWRSKNNLSDMYKHENAKNDLQEEASSEEDDCVSQTSSLCQKECGSEVCQDDPMVE